LKIGSFVVECLTIESLPVPVYRILIGASRSSSESGSRFVERMLTVVATRRHREINVQDDLTRCYQADLDGQPAPSLLPTASATRAA
jgi:hypothetical protein